MTNGPAGQLSLALDAATQVNVAVRDEYWATPPHARNGRSEAWSATSLQANGARRSQRSTGSPPASAGF